MPDPIPAPLRRADIEARELPDGSWLLFDSADGSSHAINASAGYIWHLCDGEHHVAAICSAVLARYETDAETVRQDVDRLLAEFARLGLLAAGARAASDKPADNPER